MPTILGKAGYYKIVDNFLELIPGVANRTFGNEPQVAQAHHESPEQHYRTL